MKSKLLCSGNAIWILLISVTVLDLAIPFMLSPFCKEYSYRKQVMSALGNTNTPIHSIYNVWLVTAGILLCICTYRIFKEYKNVSFSLSLTLTILLAIFALGACVLSGVFPVDESKEMVSTAAKIHGVASSMGFICLLFAPFILTLLFLKEKNWLGATISGISFLIALVAFVLFIMADKPSFENTIINNEGLWQRLTLLFMYLPLNYLAVIKIVG